MVVYYVTDTSKGRLKDALGIADRTICVWVCRNPAHLACDGYLLFPFFEQSSQMLALLHPMATDHLGRRGPVRMIALWLISPEAHYGRSFQGLWHRRLGLEFSTQLSKETVK